MIRKADSIPANLNEDCNFVLPTMLLINKFSKGHTYKKNSVI